MATTETLLTLGHILSLALRLTFFRILSRSPSRLVDPDLILTLASDVCAAHRQCQSVHPFFLTGSPDLGQGVSGAFSSPPYRSHE